MANRTNLEVAELAADERLISSSRGRIQGKIRLLSRRNLDGRSVTVRLFDDLIDGITSDLGGRENLSRIELGLIEAFAGAYLNLHDMNARLMMGAKVDVGEQRKR